MSLVRLNIKSRIELETRVLAAALKQSFERGDSDGVSLAHTQLFLLLKDQKAGDAGGATPRAVAADNFVMPAGAEEDSRPEPSYQSSDQEETYAGEAEPVISESTQPQAEDDNADEDSELYSQPDSGLIQADFVELPEGQQAEPAQPAQQASPQARWFRRPDSGQIEPQPHASEAQGTEQFAYEADEEPSESQMQVAFGSDEGVVEAVEYRLEEDRLEEDRLEEDRLEEDEETPEEEYFTSEPLPEPAESREAAYLDDQHESAGGDFDEPAAGEEFEAAPYLEGADDSAAVSPAEPAEEEADRVLQESLPSQTYSDDEDYAAEHSHEAQPAIADSVAPGQPEGEVVAPVASPAGVEGGLPVEPRAEPQGADAQPSAEAQQSLVVPTLPPRDNIYELLGVSQMSPNQEIHINFLRRIRRLLFKLKTATRSQRDWLLRDLRKLWVAHDILTDPVTRNDYDFRDLGLRGERAEVPQTPDDSKSMGVFGNRTPLRIGELLQCAGLLETAELEIACDMHRAMPEMQFGTFLVKQGFIQERDLESVLVGQKLLRKGVISVAQFQVAMELSQSRGLSISETLLDRNYVTETELSEIDGEDLSAEPPYAQNIPQIREVPVQARPPEPPQAPPPPPTWRHQIEWEYTAEQRQEDNPNMIPARQDDEPARDPDKQSLADLLSAVRDENEQEVIDLTRAVPAWKDQLVWEHGEGQSDELPEDEYLGESEGEQRITLDSLPAVRVTDTEVIESIPESIHQAVADSIGDDSKEVMEFSDTVSLPGFAQPGSSPDRSAVTGDYESGPNAEPGDQRAADQQEVEYAEEQEYAQQEIQPADALPEGSSATGADAQSSEFGQSGEFESEYQEGYEKEGHEEGRYEGEESYEDQYEGEYEQVAADGTNQAREQNLDQQQSLDQQQNLDQQQYESGSEAGYGAGYEGGQEGEYEGEYEEGEGSAPGREEHFQDGYEEADDQAQFDQPSNPETGRHDGYETQAEQPPYSQKMPPLYQQNPVLTAPLSDSAAVPPLGSQSGETYKLYDQSGSQVRSNSDSFPFAYGQSEQPHSSAQDRAGAQSGQYASAGDSFPHNYSQPGAPPVKPSTNSASGNIRPEPDPSERTLELDVVDIAEERERQSTVWAPFETNPSLPQGTSGPPAQAPPAVPGSPSLLGGQQPGGASAAHSNSSPPRAKSKPQEQEDSGIFKRLRLDHLPSLPLKFGGGAKPQPDQGDEDAERDEHDSIDNQRTSGKFKSGKDKPPKDKRKKTR